MFTTNIVFTPLHGLSFNKINFSAKDLLQFSLYIYDVKQAPIRIRSESYQYIHVTIGAEVITQDGAEESELSNLPPPTELGDFLTINRDTGAHVSVSSATFGVFINHTLKYRITATIDRRQARAE